MNFNSIDFSKSLNNSGKLLLLFSILEKDGIITKNGKSFLKGKIYFKSIFN